MTLIDPYIVNKCDNIKLLIADSLQWSSSNERLGAHLAAYITVLMVGVLEDCIEHIIIKRAHKTADIQIENYITKVIGERFRNPDYGAISGLLKEFGPEYQMQFKDKFLYNGNEATALDSIVSNKNSLAHMGTIKLQITLREVEGYYNRIIPILEELENILI